jgi:hypothetical protein
MKKILFSAAVLMWLANTWADSTVIGQVDSQNQFPFGGAAPSNPGTRYQQAYAAAAFTGIGAMSISGIDFLHGFGFLRPGTYQLSFSTITAGINTLSSTDFNSNLGPDNTLFRTVTLSGATDPTLTFTGIPYIYNPANGNLLLDIIVSNGGLNPGAHFDSATNSPAFSRYHNFGTGTIGWGLVTQFDYTPVPEPSSPVLIGLVVVMMALFHNRSGHRARSRRFSS